MWFEINPPVVRIGDTLDVMEEYHVDDSNGWSIDFLYHRGRFAYTESFKEVPSVRKGFRYLKQNRTDEETWFNTLRDLLLSLENAPEVLNVDTRFDLYQRSLSA